MSQPESGNGSVTTVYFVNQASGNIQISRTQFVCERARDCKCLLRFELPAQKQNNVRKKYAFTNQFFALKHYKLIKCENIQHEI